MKSLRYLLVVSPFLLASALTAQIQLDQLADKYWRISSYEMAGYKMPVLESGKNDSSIFYSDHTGKSVNSGTVQYCNWRIDSTRNVVILTYKNTDEITEFKMLRLNNKEFEFEVTRPDSITLKVLMLNIDEKK